jgi:very-short-patch-repair endonuclease
MTDSEIALWKRLRKRQILGVQFYRQKPIGSYIVDFYAPAVDLVIEVDGSQHMEKRQAQRDAERDKYLRSLGLGLLRFSSREVLKETEAVVEVIYRTMVRRLNKQNPPWPPFTKGGIR